MKKKSLTKRIVSFITAVSMTLTSTVMLIPVSAEDSGVKTATITLTDDYSKTLSFSDIPQAEEKQTTVTFAQDWSKSIDFTDVDTESGEYRYFSGEGYTFNSWDVDIASAIEANGIDLPENPTITIDDITVSYNWEFVPADEETITNGEFCFGASGDNTSGEWTDGEDNEISFNQNSGTGTISYSELTGTTNIVQPRAMWLGGTSVFSKNAGDSFVVNVTSVKLDVTYLDGESGGYKGLHDETTDSGQWKFNAHDPEGGESSGDRSADIVAAIKALNGDETIHSAVKVKDMTINYSWDLVTDRVSDNYNIAFNPCPAGFNWEVSGGEWLNAGIENGDYATFAEKSGSGSVKASDVMAASGVTLDDIYCVDIHSGIWTDNPADTYTFKVTSVNLDIEYTIEKPPVEAYISYEEVQGAQYIEVTADVSLLEDCNHDSHIGDDGVDSSIGATYCPWPGITLNKIYADDNWSDAYYDQWDANNTVSFSDDKDVITVLIPISSVENALGALSIGEQYVITSSGISEINYEILNSKPDMVLKTGSYLSGTIEYAYLWDEDAQAPVQQDYPELFPRFVISENPNAVDFEGYAALKIDYTATNPTAARGIGILFEGWEGNGIGWVEKDFAMEESGTIAIDLTSDVFEGKSFNNIHIGPLAPDGAQVGDTLAPGFAVTSASIVTSYDGEFSEELGTETDKTAGWADNGDGSYTYTSVYGFASDDDEEGTPRDPSDEESKKIVIDLDDYLADGKTRECIAEITADFEVNGGINGSFGVGIKNEDFGWTDIRVEETGTFSLETPDGVRNDSDLEFVIWWSNPGESLTISNIQLTYSDKEPTVAGWADNGDGSYTYTSVYGFASDDDEEGTPRDPSDEESKKIVIDLDDYLADGKTRECIAEITADFEVNGGIYGSFGVGAVEIAEDAENGWTSVMVEESGTYTLEPLGGVESNSDLSFGIWWSNPGESLTISNIQLTYSDREPEVDSNVYLSAEDIAGKNYLQVNANIKLITECEHESHYDENYGVDDAIGATYCPWNGVNIHKVSADGEWSEAYYNYWDFTNNVVTYSEDKSTAVYIYPIADIIDAVGELAEGDKYVILTDGISSMTYEFLESKPDMTLGTGSYESGTIEEAMDWDPETNSSTIPTGIPNITPTFAIYENNYAVPFEGYEAIKIDYTAESPEACYGVLVVLQGWEDNSTGWMEKFYAMEESGSIVIDLSELQDKVFHNIYVGPVAPGSAKIGDEFAPGFAVTEAVILTSYDGDFTEEIEKVVPDAPVFVTTADGKTGFKTLEEAMAELKTATGDIEVIVNHNLEVAALAIPKNVDSITFTGEGSITFTGTTLAVPVDTTFDVKLAAKNKTNLIDITVAKDCSLEIWSSSKQPQFINKITGTKTSQLHGNLKAASISTFQHLGGTIYINNGNMTGIGRTDAEIHIAGENASAAITEYVGYTLIYINMNEDGTLPKVTVDTIADGSSLDVVIHDAQGYEAIVASGTTILYSKNDISKNIKVRTLVLEGGDELTAYYYPKTKSIKAEVGTALDLYKGEEISEETKVGNYPNFELLFADITDPTVDYIIEVNTDLTLDAKFALPKTAKSITFTGEGSLTFTGTKLAVPVNTTFDVKLAAKNKTNLIDITVAKDVELCITENAYTLDEETDEPVQFINMLTGTKTSKFSGFAIVNNIATFGEVNVEEGYLKVNGGKATGIVKLGGIFIIIGDKATAAITEVADDAEIILVINGTVIPKVTIDKFGKAVWVGVYDEDEHRIALPSGTTILYTKNPIPTGEDAIVVKNKTALEDGEELTAYYYSKTKSIKAEVGTALNLYTGTEVSEENKVGNYPNFELLFEEITDDTVDYIIEVNTDLTLDAKFALPKTAKSITFTGEATLTFTGTNLTIPYDVTINEGVVINVDNKKCTMDIAVGKGATLENFGEINGINKLSGTNTSNLDGNFVVNNLATFDNVYADVMVMSGKVTAVNVLDGGLAIYGAKASAAIKTATVNAKIYLIREDGVLPKVTLEGIGEAIEDDTTIQVLVTDGLVSPDPAILTSGTVILYTKKADFADKINIVNNDGNLKAYTYGKVIKAEYPQAVTVDNLNTTGEEGSENNAELEKDYPNFESAVAAIDAAKDNTAEYVITLNQNIAPEKFALPKYAASVTITSEIGAMINVGKVTAITANTDLTLEDVVFTTTTGKLVTINAKKNLTVNELFGAVAAIKGGAKSTLTCVAEFSSTYRPDITGFGKVVVCDTLTTGNNFNVTELVLGTSETGAGTLIVSASTIKSSIKALDATNGGRIEYAEGAKALTFTGKDDAFKVAEDGLTISGEVVNGQAVLTTKTVDPAKLAVGIAPANEDVEYGFTQMGNNICYMGKVLSVAMTVGEEEPAEPVAYATWGDVVAAIETAKNAEADYTITLLDSYNANAAIKFPKAGTYKSIEIGTIVDGLRDVTFDFNFTGNLTLTGNTVFNKVNLGAVKNGSPAKYTINAGKNDVTIIFCDTGLLTSITGKNVILGPGSGKVINADKVKATETLTLATGTVKAIGGITAKNVEIDIYTNLVMNQGSKLAVTGDVTVFNEECKLTVTILDKITNEPATLKNNYVVATIKGEYAPDSIVLDEAHTGFALELVKGKLVVVAE